MTNSLVRVVRPGTDLAGPVLVLLHGLGSNEKDLMAFAPYLDPRLTVVAYRAPRAYGYGGFAWFDIQWLPEGKVVDEDEADVSRDRLVSEIQALRDELQPSRLVVGGFSQGAMMAMGVALAIPELVSGTLMMSGRAVPRFLDEVKPMSVPFLIQHGIHDEVLPVEDGREVREALIGLGAPVEYREYPMGHEVSMDSLQDAIAWLGKVAF